MESFVVELSYPLSFRSQDVKKLSEHLMHRHSIDIVGMKRVGISNFLRFFLNKQNVFPSVVDGKQHAFIQVDLNDLIERELFPFWTLTLKRIVDVSQKLSLSERNKQRIESLFVNSIQSQELFLVIDSVREALLLITEAGYCPTVFFLRFDRIKDVVNDTFLDNLQGMRDATNQQLSYVFTSYRSLEELLSHITSKAVLKTFSHPMYLPPALQEDMQTISEHYEKQYALQLPSQTKEELFTLIGGNVQYLQLSIIVLHEQNITTSLTQETLLAILTQDERINLYTEELWESLTDSEKTLVRKVYEGKSISEPERKEAAYLWQTGIIVTENKRERLFSPLFAHGVGKQEEKTSKDEEVHFSKKEQQLIDLLTEYKDQICEREVIVEKVWPEYQAFGVSDWAIDRLVARVRSKLREQKSPLEIKTIRTRGYKLSENK